jgi:hypothetical protein
MEKNCILCGRACDGSSGWENAKGHWLHHSCVGVNLAKTPQEESIVQMLFRWVLTFIWTYVASFLIMTIAGGMHWKLSLRFAVLGPLWVWLWRCKKASDREWNR